MTVNLHEKPQPPSELKVLDYLRARKNFSPAEKSTYENLRKGYVGELKFYKLLKSSLTPDYTLLNSLTLESNNSEFQMDSLLMRRNTLYLFEVKNFEGDFYIENNNWHVAQTGKEINNPIIQLKRSESLLRQLTQQLGYNFLIESYVIFINSEFALFQAPRNLPIILPAQLNRLMKHLNNQPSTVNNSHKQLADQLTSRHIQNSRFERNSEYNFDDLKKGVRCGACLGFLAYLNYRKLVCHQCQSEECIEAAVMRSIGEFKFLFPEKRITTRLMHEWCGVIPSDRTVKRILSKYLTTVPKGRNSYYIFEND